MFHRVINDSSTRNVGSESRRDQRPSIDINLITVHARGSSRAQQQAKQSVYVKV